MDFVKLSEQRFTAKKFDVNKKIPRDDVETLKTILQLSPSSVNSQPWVFLWGTSDSSKKRVRPAIADFNWNRIDTCSDFVVIAVRTTNSSTPFSIRKSKTAALPTKKLPKNASNLENSLLICVNVPAKLSTGKLSRPISQ